jgi:hypothetical protein
MSETNIVPADKNQALGKSIEYGDTGLMIRTVDDLKNLAKWAVESGFLPEQVRTAQQAFVLMVSGAELGLKPMAAVKFLYLTKARRVAIMTKGALAVVQSKPTYDGYREWIEHEGTPQMTACASAKRKHHDPQVKTFSVADAEAAGLLRERKTRDGQTYDSVYQSYLKDMLLSRARGRVLDVVFAAELGGILVEGVAEDADMMDARREPRLREAPLPAARDTLLDELGGAGVTTDRAPEPEFIDAEAVTIIESGPPPAAQPGAATPAGQQLGAGPVTRPAGAAREGARTVRKAVPVTLPAVLLGACARCGHEWNEMGGCDICGWPGPDIR